MLVSLKVERDWRLICGTIPSALVWLTWGMVCFAFLAIFWVIWSKRNASIFESGKRLELDLWAILVFSYFFRCQLLRSFGSSF